MSDERYTFEQARIRLEEIATLARKKDTSLEKSLDLLEEGVRLANICTDLVDHTDLSATAVIEKVEESTSDTEANDDLAGESEFENPSDEADSAAVLAGPGDGADDDAEADLADDALADDEDASAPNDDSAVPTGGEEDASDDDSDEA